MTIAKERVRAEAAAMATEGRADGPDARDPWRGPKGGEQGPPELDEVARKIGDFLNRLFGGKKEGRARGGAANDGGERFGGGSSGSSGSSPSGAPIGIGALLLLLLLGGALYSSFYIIEPAERGVALRFGRYVETTLPGLNWKLPYPVDAVTVVNVEQIRNEEIGYRSGGRTESAGSVLRESLMLTKDENIIDIKFAVQYRIKSARDYLFNVVGPQETLRQATESAVREIVGKSRLDYVLTEGRADIATRAHEQIQLILDRYGAGLEVSSVNMQDAQPPDQVQGAFFDVVKAREDKQRFINEAEAYANDILPRARGAAARILAEAQAYKAQAEARAEGESARFAQVLSEYEKAPEITRKRLYLETMESVLTRSGKVVVDVKGGNSLLYLPLDRMIGGARDGGAGSPTPRINDKSSSESDVAANAARRGDPAAGDPRRPDTEGPLMNRGKTFVAIAVALAALLFFSLFTVKEWERAIKFRLGQIERSDYEPGLHIQIPIINNVRKFDARIQTLDADPERYLTLEKKNVLVDSFVKWRIANVETFYTAAGGDMRRANLRLSQIIKDGLRGEFGKRTVQEVISGERAEIMETLTRLAGHGTEGLGIEVVDVRIKRVDLPQEVSAAVYQRMEAERERIAKEMRSEGAEAAERIRSDADRQRTVLLAETEREAAKLRGAGEAAAAAIYAETFGRNPSFFAFYRSLSAYRGAFNSAQDLLVLEPDSEFFDYFGDADGRRADADAKSR